jgi:hypothetical protein
MRSNSSDTQAADILIRDPDLQFHLEALGLRSVKEYTGWCARHGFSIRIDKHWRDRCKERYFAAQDAITDRLARKKKEKRKPRQIIEQIFDGDVDEGDLTQPRLVLIHQAAKPIKDQPTRDAFRGLLMCAEGRTGLLTTEPACPQLGIREGNTFIGGLLSLGRNHQHWIRPLNTWSPRSHNVHRQFSSLAHHLLAEYPVPRFMDSAWFRGQSEEAGRQQTWYKKLGSGESPRSLELPIPLTKRMARHFLHAPEDSSIGVDAESSLSVDLGTWSPPRCM